MVRCFKIVAKRSNSAWGDLGNHEIWLSAGNMVHTRQGLEGMHSPDDPLIPRSEEPLAREEKRGLGDEEP